MSADLWFGGNLADSTGMYSRLCIREGLVRNCRVAVDVANVVAGEKKTYLRQL